MTEPVTPLSFESILRLCAAAAPHPWYPQAYSRVFGVARAGFDPLLDELRLGGLIQLTEWVPEQGQGYVLTAEGERILNSPRDLALLREGKLASRPKAGSRPDEPTAWDRGEAARESLLSPGRPVVTYALLALNVLVFLIGAGLQNHAGLTYGETQHLTGAVRLVDLRRGEWWRLLTSCFVHAGPVHLIMNMLALYMIGPLAEAIWRPVRYLVLYGIAGLGGGCVAMILQPADAEGVFLVGASGAICGLMAGEAAWLLLNRQHLNREAVAQGLQNIAINFVIIALIGFAIKNVSNAAHFGGAALGAIAAVLLHLQRFGRSWQRWLALAGLVAVPVLCWGTLVRDISLRPQPILRKPALEYEKFNDDYLPRIRTATREARKLYQEDAGRLLLQHPTRRDEDATRKAIAALAEQRGELEKVRDRIDQGGAFADDQVEKARRVGRDYVQAFIELLEIGERCLKQGESWTEKDDAALHEKEEAVRDAIVRWDGLFAK